MPGNVALGSGNELYYCTYGSPCPLHTYARGSRKDTYPNDHYFFRLVTLPMALNTSPQILMSFYSTAFSWENGFKGKGTRKVPCFLSQNLEILRGPTYSWKTIPLYQSIRCVQWHIYSSNQMRYLSLQIYILSKGNSSIVFAVIHQLDKKP